MQKSEEHIDTSLIAYDREGLATAERVLRANDNQPVQHSPM